VTVAEWLEAYELIYTALRPDTTAHPDCPELLNSLVILSCHQLLNNYINFARMNNINSLIVAEGDVDSEQSIRDSIVAVILHSMILRVRNGWDPLTHLVASTAKVPQLVSRDFQHYNSTTDHITSFGTIAVHHAVKSPSLYAMPVSSLNCCFNAHPQFDEVRLKFEQVFALL
jgi:hypothetical protein